MHGQGSMDGAVTDQDATLQVAYVPGRCSKGTGAQKHTASQDLTRLQETGDGGHVGSPWVRNVKDGVCLRGSRHTRSTLACAEATGTAMAGG